ncbi:poly, partial [Olea europaea subsp. europaea]
IERGVPRLVINYKPLNFALQWVRYPIPQKKDLLNCLSKAIAFSKFDMKSGFWQVQIKEEDRYKGLDECLESILPQNFWFMPSNIQKTREYYETILLLIGSAITSHTPEPKDKSKIMFSKISIVRVLSYEDWGQNPWEEKRLHLSKTFFTTQETFNYFDYQNTWYKVLLFRPVTHSWFIIFNQNCNPHFPSWFQTWFQFHGLEEQILPSFSLQGFEYFKNEAKPFLKFQENLLFQFAFNMK